MIDETQNNMVSWSTGTPFKTQSTVARSSTEVEFRIMTYTTSETVWIRNLLREIQIVPITRSQLWTDNLSVKHLIHNHVFHSRMKHVHGD